MRNKCFGEYVRLYEGLISLELGAEGLELRVRVEVTGYGYAR